MPKGHKPDCQCLVCRRTRAKAAREGTTFKDVVVGSCFEYPVMPIHARRTYRKASRGGPIAFGTAIALGESVRFEDDTKVVSK